MPVTLTKNQFRQLGLLTFGAAALFTVVRLLPTGTNVPHLNYVPAGKSVIQTCDPSNPQFLPATEVQSPVAMTLATAAPAVAGQPVQAVLMLKTYGDKPIGPDDIAISNAKKIHLLIVDPTLTDYQHVHPEPADAPGAWSFTFTPHAGGHYRFFADFVPVATGVELYAWADLTVAGPPAPQVEGDIPARSERVGDAALHPAWTADSDGYRFTLTPGALPIRARKIEDLTLTIERIGGGAVPLEVIMDAFAHLVAFDDQRSGFGHMHPLEVDITKLPDPVHPTLHFKLQLPRAGRYVIWSQVKIAGKEVFAPFWFNAEP
ncbi:MAG TPA: hypothetical protein VFB27_06495 [Opitutaceae bacterium]|nr:hypothetical protein [Opitutaceae bacterium]